MTHRSELLSPAPGAEDAAQPTCQLLGTEDAVPGDQDETGEQNSFWTDSDVQFDQRGHGFLQCLPTSSDWRAPTARTESPRMPVQLRTFGSRPVGGPEHLRLQPECTGRALSTAAFAVGGAASGGVA